VKKVVTIVLAILISATVVYAEHQMTKWDLIAKARHGTGLKPDDSTATVAVRSAMDFIQTAAIYPICVDTVRIDLSASTELYALPTDCFRPLTVYMSPAGLALDWTTSGNKQRLPDESSISSEVLKRVWYEQGSNHKWVGFDPVPTAADSVQLIYEANVPEISFGSDSNTQRVYVREAYHPALLAATKAYIWERYNREDKANRLLDKAVFLINVAERKLNTPPIDVLLAPKTHTRP